MPDGERKYREARDGQAEVLFGHTSLNPAVKLMREMNLAVKASGLSREEV